MTQITSKLSTALADRYKIESRLGEGGMATVYLAEDLKHKRKVAVKVLRPELAAVLGAERFVQEITTTANLQHPHILPLFDSGEADSFLYYVMPFIDGETLRDKLNRETQLGIEEAVEITTAIADALDYAHRQNVIHRDIKPENILLHEGRPMVADFGIALAVSAAAGGRMTETGLSLGTPHYMSPEQATAEKDLTNRSDIYSLGSVLYEMLTGEPPHMGNSAQQIIMKIVTDTPRPVTELRKSVPPNVTAAVAKALERLAADRFESAAKLAEALLNPGFTTTATTAPLGSGIAGDLRWRQRFVAVSVLATVFLGAALAGWWRNPPGREGGLVRFEEAIPFPTTFLQIDVSPDGTQLAFVDRQGAGRVFVRRLDGTELRELGVAGRGPRFSPDGRSILVTSGAGEMQIAPVGGGPPRTLGVQSNQLTTAWGDDGYIYFELVNRDGLGRVSETGGAVDTLIADSTGAVHWVHAVLPAGRGLIFGTFNPADGANLFVLDLEDGSTRLLGPGGGPRTVVYSATGHLLVARDQFVLAQRFDVSRLEPTGDQVPVAEVSTGRILFAYGGGTLLYSAASGGSGLQPVIADRSGRRRQLPGLPEASFNFPEVSPDGRQIAMNLTGESFTVGDVWVYEMPEGPLTRLSLGGDAGTMSWTSDGEDLVFIKDGDAYRIRSDGSDEPELLLDRERNLSRAFIAPDGQRLFFQEAPGAWDVGVANLDEAGSDSLILSGDYWEGHPALSPDGRWLAYYSNESDRVEVFIRPLYGPGRRHQVSREGGGRPRWSDDGTELFFTQGNRLLMLATLEVGDDIRVASVEPLFEVGGQNYDVFPGDSLFAVLDVPGDNEAARDVATVVLNFDTELRRLAGGR